MWPGDAVAVTMPSWFVALGGVTEAVIRSNAWSQGMIAVRNHGCRSRDRPVWTGRAHPENL
jgi:hypothetical protein